MSMLGQVMNNAMQVDQAMIYSVVTIPIMFISIISNLRLAMLTMS